MNVKRHTRASVARYCDTTKWPTYRRRGGGEVVTAIEMVAPFADEEERVICDGYLVYGLAGTRGVPREEFEREFERCD